MLNAKKNTFTDLIIPILALILTIILLYKFNWVGQFTIFEADGTTRLNVFAILSMIIGYVVLPFSLMAWKNKK